MTNRSGNRYAVRVNTHNELWTVFDIFTGMVESVGGVCLDGLSEEDAKEVLDLLNTIYIERRKGSKL